MGSISSRTSPSSGAPPTACVLPGFRLGGPRGGPGSELTRLGFAWPMATVRFSGRKVCFATASTCSGVIASIRSM